MSYAFGWWDFVEIDGEPQMVCRDSDERVVMVGDLDEPWLAKVIAEHPKRPSDRWKRFEYRHDEFWFPLIVNWIPEEGRVLVDYNLSSELWRIETNAETEYPPYGGWVRVDDMMPDAFWCWPGVLEGRWDCQPAGMWATDPGKSNIAFFAKGGWVNKKWVNEYCSLNLSKPYDLWFASIYDAAYGAEHNGPSVSRVSKDSFETYKHFLERFNSCKKHKRVMNSLDLDQSESWSFLQDDYSGLQSKIEMLSGEVLLPYFDAAKVLEYEPQQKKTYPVLFEKNKKQLIQYVDDNRVDPFRDFVFYHFDTNQILTFTVDEKSFRRGNQRVENEVGFFLGQLTTFRSETIQEICAANLEALEPQEILLQLDEYFINQRSIAEALLNYSGFDHPSLKSRNYGKCFNASIKIVDIYLSFLGGRNVKGRNKFCSILSNFDELDSNSKQEIMVWL